MRVIAVSDRQPDTPRRKRCKRLHVFAGDLTHYLLARLDFINASYVK
jgi:hypothetical protein